MGLLDVPVSPAPIERFRTVLGEKQYAELLELVGRARQEIGSTVVWNVNSTARGGGVAELLQALIAYSRGAGIDARWLVVDGPPEFFQVTKRLHNELHGSAVDRVKLTDEERAIYLKVSEHNAAALLERMRPGDVVLLHDPQTAGLVAPLVRAGSLVVWRCHIGTDQAGESVRGAWEFLTPLVREADAFVFHRQAFVWPGLDQRRVHLIRPSVDAFSPKNQDISPVAVHGILAAAGVLADGPASEAIYQRLDGTRGRVERRMFVDQEGPLPSDVPVVVQVSRWDALKDPAGVLQAFARAIAPAGDAHLLLGGPDVTAVADDPEGREVLAGCHAIRDELPEDVRARVHLAALPMEDVEENAAMVNALQRYATVVVQKSVAEGFGLTVAEAMWKGRPVVAGRVGGIQEQIEHGRSGILVNPTDLDEFAGAVNGLLGEPRRAARLGQAARERVRREFLGPRHLEDYGALVEELLRERAGAPGR
ncbi:MAG: glycosyltransferase [Actinobacteria bacterium]|nr:MAG: glycosyltransferase [Actinomycetota bacterium]